MQKTVKDQLGSEIKINYPPKRIVSLVPSQTELLFDLGLRDEVVGITKFCIHPNEWYKTKTKVGGTKNVNIEKIRDLKPDLILGNKEENNIEDIETLRKEFPVWMSDIETLPDAMKMITDIGEIVNRAPEAEYLNHLIKTGFTDLGVLSYQSKFRGKRVLYLIWKNPYMAAGKDTFIQEMLTLNGFENAVSERRYPELSNEKIQELNPDVVFLSSEPYPFKKVHVAELQLILPNAKIELVDGEMFSWYGSRMVKAVQYFFEFPTVLSRKYL